MSNMKYYKLEGFSLEKQATAYILFLCEVDIRFEYEFCSYKHLKRTWAYNNGVKNNGHTQIENFTCNSNF